MAGSNNPLRLCRLFSDLGDRFEKGRKRQAKSARNFRHSLDGGISQACFDSSDVGPIELCTLGQVVLSPLLFFSALPNPCSNVAQERIPSLGHASGCRCPLAKSIDYQ